MIKVGCMLVERYDIIERIGSGGMSIVYKAKDTKLGRFVAIKVLREEYCLDDSFVSKFKVEAQSAASLSHNNIVNIYDVGQESRTHFIVMEYLEGETLKEYITNNGHLSDQEILKITVCIASALEHAHNNHIIHRDIKPQNIMLVNDGKVKVMDFGIARIATGNTIEMPENPTGSVHYIAPEQAKGSFQDNKSDIYSLGIIMYEMATGVVPFNGDTAVSVALKQIHEEIPNPLDLNENLSQNINTIIIKATQKKILARYQSALEVINDIKKCMSNPDDVLVYTNSNVSEETMIMSHEEMKHIWSKSEVREYSGKKDPFDKVVATLGVILAILIVSMMAIYTYNNITPDYIPVTYTVPGIIGETVKNATITLNELTMDINVNESVYSQDYEEGQIISQNPAINSVVEENTIINVVISKGIKMENVIGVLNMFYEDAVNNLEAKGFIVEIITEHNAVAPIGNVISQNPLARENVPVNSTVTIYVSNGPKKELLEVPKISSELDLNEAKTALELMGFTIGIITHTYDDNIIKDYIISTSVEAGREVEKGYVIDLVVSKGPKIVSVTKPFALSNIAEAGQDSYKLTVTLELKNKTEIIYENTVDASFFPLSIEATGTGTGIIHVLNNDVQIYQTYIFFTEEVEEEVVEEEVVEEVEEVVEGE